MTLQSWYHIASISIPFKINGHRVRLLLNLPHQMNPRIPLSRFVLLIDALGLNRKFELAYYASGYAREYLQYE